MHLDLELICCSIVQWVQYILFFDFSFDLNSLWLGVFVTVENKKKQYERRGDIKISSKDFSFCVHFLFSWIIANFVAFVLFLVMYHPSLLVFCCCFIVRPPLDWFSKLIILYIILSRIPLHCYVYTRSSVLAKLFFSYNHTRISCMLYLLAFVCMICVYTCERQ